MIEATLHAINTNDGLRKIGDAATFEDKKIEHDYERVKKLEKEINHLSAANEALQKRHPGERE